MSGAARHGARGRTPRDAGIALPLAIVALVVVGALVAGAFVVGLQEQRLGRGMVRYQQAFGAAQEALEQQVARWTQSGYGRLAPGDSSGFEGIPAAGPGRYRGSVRRLNEVLFLVDAEGFGPDRGTRQRVGLLVRLSPLELDIAAAATTPGAVRLSGSSHVDGADNVPTSWPECSSPEPTGPGIRTSHPDSVAVGDGSTVGGDPPIRADSIVTGSVLTRFGGRDWDEVVALATKTIGEGPYDQIHPRITASGACDRAHLQNWGDPRDPVGACRDEFPIIYAPAPGTRLTGGYGQGLLLVDGDLEVDGGAEFYGPVIVRGVLRVVGSGGRLLGGVIAGSVSLSGNPLLGEARLAYSSCSLRRALSATAPTEALAERSWVHLY